jgi:hypothetical protein
MLCRRKQLLSHIKGHGTHCKFSKLPADLVKFKHLNFSFCYYRGQINLSPKNNNKPASTVSIPSLEHREKSAVEAS